ncbi:MAG: GTP 3',8-cyclase MoaA [Desulfurococcales archaeon]|nr:GTP 3',8-cyclase MoaA [Desulfurococcales archaeon]
MPNKRLAVKDAYGRYLNNLRIAVTAECNYRCIFCHIEGEPLEGPVKPGVLSAQITSGEYALIAEAAWRVGVDKFKLTGGEPLLRADIVDIIRSIRESAPKAEISMTTNGYFLEKLAVTMREAGLQRVNVSVHSLDPERYAFITGVPGLDRALRGVKAAVDSGLGVKINMVVLRDVNSSEIWDMLEYARAHGATLQLIELHPVGLGARFFQKYFYPLSKIERELSARGAKVLRRSLHNRPVYILPDGARIEIVRPYSNPLFCAGCTRIRLGPFGDLSPCLNWRGPRPSILGILKNRELSREEKIILIASKMVDLVAQRRPYYLWPVRDGQILYEPGGVNTNNRTGRMSIPKRLYFLKVKEELERLQAGGGSP